MANGYTGYDYLLFDILNDQVILRDYSTHLSTPYFPPTDKKNHWLIDGLVYVTVGSEDFDLLKVIYGLNGYIPLSMAEVSQKTKIDMTTLTYRRGIILGKLKTKADLFQSIKDKQALAPRTRLKIRKDIDIVSRIRYVLEHEDFEPNMLIFTSDSPLKALTAEDMVLVAMLVNIEQLKLSVRATRALQANGCRTLYDIININQQTPVIKMEGVGKTSAKEIHEAASHYGFILA